jgi:hypothetical protein
MNKLKAFIKKHFMVLIGILAGAIGGFFYWKLVGCHSGHCPITGSPLNSTLYGAFLGGLLFSLGKPSKKETTNK